MRHASFPTPDQATLRGLTPWSSALLLSLLAACSSPPKPGTSGGVPALPTPVPQPYATDGPLPDPPKNLVSLPDPVPRIEPLRNGGPNKPYQAAGETYVPILDDRPVIETGLASWYGRKFHGRPTASGELYNMYAMTAAHPTLPIPSYARVRNPANGREVIVRVNDRGPFSKGRIVDLSYTAALKLDVLRGVRPVELERITHEAIRSGSWRRDAAAPMEASAGDTLLAQAEPAVQSLPPGTPVRQRELWAQDLSLNVPPPAAGPTPLPMPAAPPSSDTGADNAAPQPPASSVSVAPTALPIPAALPLPSTALKAPPAVTSPAALQADPARTSAGRGWWVQLGAFRDRNGALDFQHEMARVEPWLGPLLALFDERGLHKLQAGPFPAKAEAQSALVKMKEALRLQPILLERR